MNFETSISIRKHIEIKTSLVYMILLSIMFIAVSYTLSFQAGMPAYWTNITLYFKFFVFFLDVVFLSIHLEQNNGKIDILSIRIYLCLLYIALIAFLVFASSILKLFADGFAWPLTYLVFFQYFKKHDSPQNLKLVVVLCHYICCLFLVRTILTIHLDGTNLGPVYHAIVFLPMILLLCKKKEVFIHSLFTFILLFLSAKRTGLITLILGFSSYFILTIKNQNSQKKKWKVILGVLLLALLLIVFSSFYSVQANYILQRLSSISKDQGSGRFRVWAQIIELVKESPLNKKVFGHGFQAVPYFVHPYKTDKDKFLFAHNSYIEILYDLGFVGLVIIVLVVISILCFLLRLIRANSSLAPTAAFAICIVLAFSLTSYFFEESNYIMMISVYWGIIRGKSYKKSTILLHGIT